MTWRGRVPSGPGSCQSSSLRAPREGAIRRRRDVFEDHVAVLVDRRIELTLHTLALDEVVNRAAPAEENARGLPGPAQHLGSGDLQLDMHRVGSDESNAF